MYDEIKDIESIIEQYRDLFANEGGKKYFITGASGLLGGAVLKLLIALNQTLWVNQKCKIIVAVRDIYSFVDTHNITNEVTVIQCDIITPILYDEEVDYIIHSAGVCNSILFKEQPALVMKSNLIGTYNLLEFALRCSCKKVVNISSGYIYGIDSDAEIDEKMFRFETGDLTSFPYSYITSKISGETLCNSYAKEYSLDISTVRPFNIYGPYQSKNHGGILTELLRSIRSKNIKMESEGNVYRNFVYNWDVVAAVFFALYRGNTGEAYNVCADSSIKIKHFVTKWISYAKDQGIHIELCVEIKASKNDSDILGFNPSNEKIKELGWKTLTSLDEGICKTISSLMGENLDET